MNHIKLIAFMLLAALLAAIIVPSFFASRKRIALGFLTSASLFVGNLRETFIGGPCRTANATTEDTTTTHERSVSRLADATLTTKYLLVKKGTDNDHVATTGVSDIPYGVTADEPTAGDAVTVLLLGKGPTKKMIAGEAMATTGVRVYAGSSGKVALTGTVEVGILLSAGAADGSIVEVADYPPPSAPGISSTSASLVTPDIGAATGTSLVLSGAVTAVGGTLTGQSLVTPTIKDLTEVVTATNVIAAGETGSVFFLNSATEFVSTLPAPAAGLHFTFIVTAAPSGASYTVVTNASANIIKGNQNSVAGDAGDFGTGDDTISFVDGQSVAGDKVELFCDGTSWFAYAISKVAAGITFTTAS